MEQYFAANPDPKETVNVLLKKSKDHYSKLHSNKYLDKLRLMWRAYHGIYGEDLNSHEISFIGDQGELVSLPVNHFRNIALHLFNMITANRPVMEARAVNTDYKSLAQTYLATSILDYYMREKHLEDAIKRAVEYAIVLGSGYVRVEWNETAGEKHIDEESGIETYEGELEFTNLSPFDVVFDGTKDTWNHDWLLVRSKRNKYDLMAKYPDLAEQIHDIETVNHNYGMNFTLFSNDSTDDIFIYEFFHKRTESVPEGRYLLFLDNDVVLMDQGLPYRTIPIFRISAGEILGTPYAYSPMFDLYPLQEAINATYSTILTNQTAFGVGNVWVPDGANIAVSTVAGGLNLMQGGNTAPVAVNLTQTPKEIFDFLQLLIQSQETLSGINSVTRGNPEASLRSGQALALVQSMAIQFVSTLQQSYVKLIEDVGTSLIQILKDYARSPKIVTLVGKYNRTYLKEFTGEDLNSINRVIVDVGNPLSRTIAGRVQMAEQFMQYGLITNPQQYHQVVNTGRVESATEGTMAELLNVKKENEYLMTGKLVRALAYDSHKLHILEHRSILADPELRQNPEVERAVNTHIQEHIDALRIIDPDVLMLLGEQPLIPMDQLLAGQTDMGMPAAPENQGSPAEIKQNNGGNVNTAAQIEQMTKGDPNSMLPPVPEVPESFNTLQ